MPARIGSSPLTRGKPHLTVLQGRHDRLIPAHAGKTSPGGPASAALAAHPRSRGENALAQGQISAEEGSSPLTRGKRRHGQTVNAADGLIPAHAGKTTRRCRRGGSIGAHPRSRGENKHPTALGMCARGSSPLTRGKHSEASHGLAQGRLIPAHAGKTVGDGTVDGHGGAHPRSRGENTS